MTASPPSVILWYRRDLRISDHTALLAAAADGLPVVPVYINSIWKRSHAWTGPKRQEFLCGCLSSLASNLETIGGRLIVREGDPVGELRKLIAETRAVAIHWNEVPDPHGRETERRVRAMAAELGVACHGHADACLHAPDEVLTQDGKPYRVYTPYSRNWLAIEKRAPLGRPRDLRTPAGISSLPLPDVSHWSLAPSGADLPEAGEKAARQRLKRALAEKIRSYGPTRDFPAIDGTSRLSQDLRFGIISIRTVYAETMKLVDHTNAPGRDSIIKFVKELAWREFYFAILHHYPNVLDEEFNPDWRGIPWDEPGKTFELWQQGRTGFPIVDAGMRELVATGHMHNRVRMITAMFLTKDLHVDWKLGESFFLQHLVDGEVASNNGGWQWSAGTGADAAPYFRIQNPWSQTARYDPDGIYIKRWVPELKDVHPSKLLEPPQDGRPVAPGYEPPCLDHAVERDRTLAIFQRHKEARGS